MIKYNKAQFLFGLGACAALAGGAGLPWLVAVHYLVDAWAVVGAGSAQVHALALAGYAALLLGACAPFWFLKGTPPERTAAAA